MATPTPKHYSHDKQPQPPAVEPAQDLVEVRVTGMHYRRDAEVFKRGDVIKVTRAEYDATCEVRDGVRLPSYAFALASEERAKAEAAANVDKANFDRHMKARESAIASMEANLAARARERTIAADAERQLAEATKPLTQPGAVRTG